MPFVNVHILCLSFTGIKELIKYKIIISNLYFSPMNEAEKQNKSFCAIQCPTSREIVVQERPLDKHTKKFSFDRAFDGKSKQVLVWKIIFYSMTWTVNHPYISNLNDWYFYIFYTLLQFLYQCTLTTKKEWKKFTECCSRISCVSHDSSTPMQHQNLVIHLQEKNFWKRIQ